MKNGIFLSYRRADVRHVAGRLARDLEEEFGEGRVFRDVENISPGLDFTEVLRDALDSCAVMLVLIGPKWQNLTDASGKRRLENPDDWARQEIATGLERNVRVVPVLVEGAQLPEVSELPDNLKALARRQAIPLSDERWRGDVDRLVQALRKIPELENAGDPSESSGSHDTSDSLAQEPPKDEDFTEGPAVAAQASEASVVEKKIPWRILWPGAAVVLLSVIGFVIWQLLPDPGPKPVPDLSAGDELCVVSGLVKKSPAHGMIALLDESCRPSGRLIFNLNHHQFTARVDVLANGEVRWQYGTAAREWISLDGIVFQPGDGGDVLSLLNGWKNYGGEYRPAAVASVGGLCVVSGLVNKSATLGTIASLPSMCRPDKRLIFNLNHSEYTARIDVLPSGEITWVAGTPTHSWISLSGIVFKPDNAGDTLSLLNGWSDYSDEYRGASITKTNGLCLASGLIKKSMATGLMALLPGDCRPSGRLIFNLNHHQHTARVDALANGEILWHSGTPTHPWISLDGLVFKPGDAGQPLQLVEGWQDYGGDYRPSGWQRMDSN